MGYRIRYGRKMRKTEVWRVQVCVAVGLYALIVILSTLFPWVKQPFVAEPNPAQEQLAQCYASGQGIRECWIQYCAELLEWAGYDREIYH